MKMKLSANSYGLISPEYRELIYGSMFGILLMLQLRKFPRPWKGSPASRPEPRWDMHLALLSASARWRLTLELHRQSLPPITLWVKRPTGQSYLWYCASCTCLIYHMVLEVTMVVAYLTALSIKPHIFFFFCFACSSQVCNQFLVLNSYTLLQLYQKRGVLISPFFKTFLLI